MSGRAEWLTFSNSSPWGGLQLNCGRCFWLRIEFTEHLKSAAESNGQLLSGAVVLSDCRLTTFSSRKGDSVFCKLHKATVLRLLNGPFPCLFLEKQLANVRHDRTFIQSNLYCFPSETLGLSKVYNYVTSYKHRTLSQIPKLRSFVWCSADFLF